MRPTPEQEVVRAARVYRTNRDAAKALGVTSSVRLANTYRWKMGIPVLQWSVQKRESRSWSGIGDGTGPEEDGIGRWQIVHRCLTCGCVRRNKVAQGSAQADTGRRSSLWPACVVSVTSRPLAQHLRRSDARRWIPDAGCRGHRC